MKIIKSSCVVTSIRRKYADVEMASGQNIVVPIPADGIKLRKGDRVTVILEESSLRRVTISVILPVILTCLIAFGFYVGTGNGFLSIMTAMIVLGPYFSYIWIMKDSLARTAKIVPGGF